MKDLFKNGVIVLLIIAALYIIFLRECKSPPPCPAKDEVLIRQTTWDSILMVANKPPQIRIDTVWKTRPTVTPNPQPDIPKPVVIDEGTDIGDLIYGYSDTLKNKEIDVWVNYSIRGELVDREWHYNPITTEISVDSIIYKPYPVEVENPVKTPQKGFYVYSTAGGNKTAFLFGGGLDYITKKQTMLGYQYQRFGNENIHSIKLGVKLFK